ncbi:MAG: ABC transporter ATP-binding protein [Ilumatobacteraceae bacterium]|jgi:ABC-type glutathione transport system ATPase component
MSIRPVLSVRDLRVALSEAHRELVHGIDFDVFAGETVGLVGESGSGKSLTLRSICGLLPDGIVRSGGVVAVDIDGSGEVRDGADLRGRGLAMVFQEPMSSLNPTMRIGDLVTIGPRTLRGLSRKEARSRSLELMREVGIPDAERRMRAWPHELSGGLRQRVMIAMALATDPKILLCDEPTTALDVSVQDQILRLLMQLKENRGLSMVLVTHDLGVVSQVCDRVMVMENGLIVESGSTSEILNSPRHDYTRSLIEAAQ